MNHIHIQEKEYRETALGIALYIRVFTDNYQQLSWSEVWNRFAQSYPGQWAIQCFPPHDQVVDEENIYHLFVLDCPPQGFNIRRN